jgi:hypothetical protein
VTEATLAETLGITEGSIVWVVADSIEETALLDPLPAGAETVAEPVDSMDAAVLVADNLAAVNSRLDEVLPELGSTPVAWIAYPSGHPRELDRDALVSLVGEYGWRLSAEVRLDETWSAVRLRPL